MTARPRGGPSVHGGGPPGLSESGGVRAAEYANRLRNQDVFGGAPSSHADMLQRAESGNVMPAISGITSPGSAGGLNARQQVGESACGGGRGA
eukprot:371408-Alexandrium_andersonii.AAC.1